MVAEEEVADTAEADPVDTIKVEEAIVTEEEQNTEAMIVEDQVDLEAMEEVMILEKEETVQVVVVMEEVETVQVVDLEVMEIENHLAISIKEEVVVDPEGKAEGVDLEALEEVNLGILIINSRNI